MTVTITIDTGNASFGDTPGDEAREVARVLRDAARRLHTAGEVIELTLRDWNGNAVGSLKRSTEANEENA